MFNVYNMNKKSDIAVFMKKKKSLLNPILMGKKYDSRSPKCGEPYTKMWGAIYKNVGSCIEDFVQILDNYVIMKQYVQCS